MADQGYTLPFFDLPEGFATGNYQPVINYNFPIWDNQHNYDFNSNYEVNPGNLNPPDANSEATGNGAEHETNREVIENRPEQDKREDDIKRLIAAMKDCSSVTDPKTAYAYKRISAGDYYHEDAYR